MQRTSDSASFPLPPRRLGHAVTVHQPRHQEDAEAGAELVRQLQVLRHQAQQPDLDPLALEAIDCRCRASCAAWHRGFRDPSRCCRACRTSRPSASAAHTCRPPIIGSTAFARGRSGGRCPRLAAISSRCLRKSCPNPGTRSGCSDPERSSRTGCRTCTSGRISALQPEFIAPDHADCPGS